MTTILNWYLKDNKLLCGDILINNSTNPHYQFIQENILKFGTKNGINMIMTEDNKGNKSKYVLYEDHIDKLFNKKKYLQLLGDKYSQ